MNRRDLLKLGIAATLPTPAFSQVLPLSTGHAKPATTGSPVSSGYICPPCGLPCDALIFDKPGSCPNCGMTLVPTTPGKDSPPSVTIFIFNGAQLIDFAGPWEVFGTAGMLVHTVAESLAPVTAVFGEKVIPDYSFENCPQSDIVLLPGGGVWNEVINNAKVMQWIQTQVAAARHVMSVCTGAFLLQKAGVLGGQTVTATYGMIEDLAAPGTKVVYDRRFVDNGKIITTAGLSAGIDGALHLVSRVLGLGTAQSVALSMEYNWDPDAHYARAALADRYLPDGLAYAKPNIKGAKATMVSTAGDRDRWETTIAVYQPNTVTAIMELMRERIAANTASGGMFKPVPHIRDTAKFSREAANVSELSWTFTDDQGGDWKGSCTVHPSPQRGDEFLVTFKLLREGIAAPRQ